MLMHIFHSLVQIHSRFLHCLPLVLTYDNPLPGGWKVIERFPAWCAKTRRAHLYKAFLSVVWLLSTSDQGSLRRKVHSPSFSIKHVWEACTPVMPPCRLHRHHSLSKNLTLHQCMPVHTVHNKCHLELWQTQILHGYCLFIHCSFFYFSIVQLFSHLPLLITRSLCHSLELYHYTLIRFFDVSTIWAVVMSLFQDLTKVPMELSTKWCFTLNDQRGTNFELLRGWRRCCCCICQS